MESTGPVVAHRDPLCLLGSGNAVDEGGNSTCTKPSEDAELGGFANTREIREVRKKLQETQRPSLENAKQIHLEGNRGRPQRVEDAALGGSSSAWRGACSSAPLC